MSAHLPAAGSHHAPHDDQWADIADDICDLERVARMASAYRRAR